MFNRKHEAPKPATVPTPPPRVPQDGPVLAQLRSERNLKREAMIDLERVLDRTEREVIEIELKISWIERHPEAEGIFAFVDAVRARHLQE